MGSGTVCVHKDWQSWHNPSLQLQPLPLYFCPHQATLNRLQASAAKTAARCHTFDPQWQQWAMKADGELCEPSNMCHYEGLPLVSNSSLPILKYLLGQPHRPAHPRAHAHQQNWLNVVDFLTQVDADQRKGPDNSFSARPRCQASLKWCFQNLCLMLQNSKSDLTG